jgi:uncharacterized protein involved in response to NO
MKLFPADHRVASGVPTVSSILLTISEPSGGPGRVGPAPYGLPFLRLGFRPFYLSAALAAVALMALWPAVFLGQLRPASGLAPTLWHAHEMIFGCIAAVVVGFLFTAGKVWTGRATPRGPALAALALLWLAGRLAGLLAPALVFLLVDTAFLVVVAAIFGALVLRSRNWRNAGVALLLAMLAAVNLAFHVAVAGGLADLALRPLQAALALLIVLESVIGGRVIPAFTRSAMPGVATTGRAWLDRLAIGATVLGLGAWLGGAAPYAAAVVLGIAAAAQGARLAGWRPWVARRRPILWILHASYAWIPQGLALLAAACAGALGPSAGVHALAVGATGGLVIGMLTRTARGHTGRTLQASRAEVAAYVLVMAAAALRVAAALEPRWWLVAVCAAGTCWIAAFALYLWRFVPWLVAARLDAKDG